MMSYQQNPFTNCKSAQWCTRRGHPYHSPSYIAVSTVLWDRQTHIHTDGRNHYTFRVVYDSCNT